MTREEIKDSEDKKALKSHRVLIELIKKEKTEHWAIPIKESHKLITQLSKVAEKNWYEAYLKWHKKKVLDYQPTGKTYTLTEMTDVLELSWDQFEMFIEDFRNWFRLNKNARALAEVTWLDITAWAFMTRLDTWKNEEIVKVQANVTNKI